MHEWSISKNGYRVIWTESLLSQLLVFSLCYNSGLLGSSERGKCLYYENSKYSYKNFLTSNYLHTSQDAINILLGIRSNPPNVN